MYYYNKDTDNNNIQYNNNVYNQPQFNDSSLEELPTHVLNNQAFQDSFIHDSLFQLNDNNWDFFSQDQQDILLSDPNFLRQHQLLQTQQKEMHTRLQQDETNNNFDNIEMNSVNSHSIHNHPNPSIITPTEETTKQQQQKEQTQQQTQQQKQQKQKSNNGNSLNSTNPSRRQPTTSTSSQNQEEDKNDPKIDHQRRFNELQARFRVNYARKPNQQQSNQNKTNSNKSKAITNQPNPTSANPSTSTSLPTTPKGSTKNTLSASTQSNTKAARPNRIELPPSVSNFLTPHTNTTTTNSIPSTPPGLPIHPSPNALKSNGDESTKEALSSSFPSRTMPIQIQRVSRANHSQNFDAESYQRQLDNQLDKVDFNDITVSELKEMLRQRGKPATGKKAILLQRLHEEREIAKQGRGSSMNINRHSQPLPLSHSFTHPSEVSHTPHQRPNSFQGNNSSSFNYHDVSTLSPSLPSFLPLGSPGGQLNRSIANMHIGSPPATSRRYSPYSPRLGSSPKLSYFEYSPSNSGHPLSSPTHSTTPIPNINLPPEDPTTPNNISNGLSLSPSYSGRLTPGRYYNNPKSYKPFTSSTLATPDREEDINPFDAYYARIDDIPIKEEDVVHDEHHGSFQLDANYNAMDWSNPQSSGMAITQNEPHSEFMGQTVYGDEALLLNEQMMTFINNQQRAAFNFKLDDSGFNPINNNN